MHENGGIVDAPPLRKTASTRQENILGAFLEGREPLADWL
jgi:hypothetical protein